MTDKVKRRRKPRITTDDPWLSPLKRLEACLDIEPDCELHYCDCPKLENGHCDFPLHMNFVGNCPKHEGDVF